MSEVESMRQFNRLLAAARRRLRTAQDGLQGMADSLQTESRDLVAAGTPSLAAMETLLRDDLDGYLAPLGQLATAATGVAEDLDEMDGDVRMATDGFEADATAAGTRFEGAVESFVGGSTAAEQAMAAAAEGFGELGTAVEQAFDRVVDECLPGVVELAERLAESATQATGAAIDAGGASDEISQVTRTTIAAVYGASARLQITHDEVKQELERFHAAAVDQGLGAAATLTVALQEILDSGIGIATAGLGQIGEGLEEFVSQILDSFVEELEAWPQALDGAAAHWDGLRDQVGELEAIDEVVTHIQHMLVNMGQ